MVFGCFWCLLRCIHTLKGHHTEIVCVAFNVQGTHVATGSMDNTAKLWDVARPRFHALHRLTSFDYSSSRLLEGSWSRLRLFARPFCCEVDTGQQIASLEGHSAEIVSLNFNTDGDKILTGSFDNTAKVWEVRRREIELFRRRRSVQLISFQFISALCHIMF